MVWSAAMGDEAAFAQLVAEHHAAPGPQVMTGEGAYKGLTAVLIWTEGGCFLGFRGIVVEFPDPPVPATSE